MSRLLKTFLLATVLGATCAQADEAKTPPQKDNNFYAGVGMFSDMLNMNVEAVTPWGNFMVRAGQFQGVKEGIATNLSWRKPLEGDNANYTGYYVGLFGGQVSGDIVSGKLYERLGGGGEIGYQMVTDYTRTELTVGLGTAQRVKRDDVELAAKPMIFISVNVALGY